MNIMKKMIAIMLCLLAFPALLVSAIMMTLDATIGHPNLYDLVGFTGELEWGVSQARRAWVEPAVVLNTRSRADLLAYVRRDDP